MKSNKYQLIIFDWDGTLSDSSAHIIDCVHAGAEKAGLPRLADEVIRQYIGINLEQFMRYLYPKQSDQIYDLLIEGFRAQYFLKRDGIHLYPEAKETITQLKSTGYDVAIATGKSRDGLELALKETELTDIISLFRCSDDGYTKPDPRILTEIMDIMGVDKSNTLMVGDTSYDMELANNAGVGAIGVDYGMHSVDVLKQYKPLTILHKMSDLIAYLKFF